MSGLFSFCRRHWLAVLRYVLLVGWGVLWMTPANHYTLGMFNDWLPFEIGARTLVHYHHIRAFQTPALHLYADTPQLQFGPLPIYLLAMFQAFRPHTVTFGFGIAMIAAGVASMGAVETTALRVVDGAYRTTVRRCTLAAQVVLVPIWGFEVGYWHHIDDVIALLCISFAILLVTRQGPWWAFGLLMGTAAATKPWAVIAVPLLLALPRRDWVRTAGVTVVTAVAWWAPFLIAAPDTITAIGHFQTVPFAGSVLYVLGQHSNGAHWLRPLQFLAGMAIVAFVVRRRCWQDALLAGMAVRIVLDPYAYSYYVFAPMLAALLVDLTRVDRSRFPRWTAATVALVWVLPRLDTHIPLWGHTFSAVHAPTLVAIARLAWAVLVVAYVVVPAGRSVAVRDALTPGRARATTA